MITLLLILSACKGVKKESAEWRKQVEKSIQDMTVAVDGVSKAIPGERYLRLVENARTGTAEEKAKAREDIKAIFGVDPLENNWEVKVNFNFQSDQNLLAGAFMDLSGLPSVVEQAILEQRLNVREVGSTLVSPISDTELKDKIFTSISHGVGLMSGEPDVLIYDGNNAMITWPNSSLMPSAYASLPTNSTAQARRTLFPSIKSKIEQRAHINQYFTDAIWHLREPLRQRQMGEPAIVFDWDPIDGGNIFIFVEEEVLKEIREIHGDNHVLAEAVIQQKNTLNRFKNFEDFQIRISQFFLEGRRKEVPGVGFFRWAPANLTRSTFIDPQAIDLDAFKRLNKNLKKLQELGTELGD